MLAYSTWLLHWIRTLGHRFFLQFGLHCATHQIRVILISGVVITSLFYPALDLYTSKNSVSVLEALTSSNVVSDITAQADLANLWSGHDTLRVHEDAVTRAKCRDGQALRAERILIQTPLDDDDGVLNHRILLSTLNLERRLEGFLSSGNSQCLKIPSGKCLVISPLAFWGHNQDSLLSDPNILDTLGYSKNISVSGVFITPQMVLAGRGSYDHHAGGNKFDYATHLALTYFFPQSACWGSSAEHASWVQIVQNAATQNAEAIVRVPEATLIALEYDPNRSDNKHWSAFSASLYLGYLGFLVYVGWSVRRMDKVHSRVGVTFTALVEIAVSTITSLSVCTLVGFKITMVPWELLPIVIGFVGAENMFNLVDAVGETSVNLSVKRRIAEGLSRAGTSNTLKVVSYNAILGIIAVFAVGAVRQFCIFATVVLVAHWFLAHTFFIAVLSIDIARLELEELLRHDTSLVPSVPSPTSNSKTPSSGWQRLIMTIQNLLQGRATTNISLLMLLGIAGTLYYTTYTASTSMPHAGLPKPHTAVSRMKSRLSTDTISTAEVIWKTLNPTQMPLLHVRLEMPTILTFSLDVNDPTHPSVLPARSRSVRTFKFVLWLFSIMVVPIAITIGTLYGLLLYLLKNTELLEAQRNRQEAQPFSLTHQEEDMSLEGRITFSTLPRALPSDVELIATSKDGKVVVSVGLHNEITVWIAEKKKHIAVDGADLALRMASTSASATASTVVSVTVEDKGRYFAVGTGAGLIALWSIEKSSGKIKPLPLLALDNSSSAVREIHFVPSAPIMKPKQRTPSKTRASSDTDSPESPSATTTLLATYETGLAARWSIRSNFSSVTFFTPPRRMSTVVCALLLHVIPNDRVLIAFCMDDGTLDIVETGDFEPTILHACCIQPGNPFDMVTRVHACRVELNGSVRLVIAAATQAGFVSLWDGLTGECISILEEAYGNVSHLRVSPVRSETCHFCGKLPMESLSIAFSVDHVIRFLKLYIEDQTRRCSCTRTQAQHQQHQLQQQLRRTPSRENLDRRSRSSSNASSSQAGSPLMPRARLATAFEASATSAFPVSGHGVHSRRASEKDTSRRSSELLLVPPFPANAGNGEEDHGNGGYHDQSGATTPTNASHSVWRNAVVVALADITCERGGWDVSNKQFVGIRRKPRSQAKSKLATSTPSLAIPVGQDRSPLHGLTSATLERWELWTFDPALVVLKSSLLAKLATGSDTLPSASSSTSSSSPSRTSLFSSTSSSSEYIARLPFTRVSPLLTAPSHALAGFGNTIGVFHFSS